MKKITSLILGGIILLLSSCASIVSTSKYPISINSNPSEANIVVTDKKGDQIYSGNTPANLILKASAGFFVKAEYRITFTKDGYNTKTVPVKFKLDGWYFGNILIGGLIGMLIVDPATGAMYKLEVEVFNETLYQSTANLNEPELKVYDINEIPSEWHQHLAKVSK
ncbi:hypothetical protein [Aestuariivivens sediminis]|uniref:hypothetical protein n=1 Tax=Aestuariivivens sediminis TaxID=2913557 RepID=UPI001F5706DA|nr:hypothetical protein [Aestuariivivens sediminis]